MAVVLTLTPMAVHPRVHGEDTKWSQTNFRSDGSPPCARGRPEATIDGLRRSRFTPVCTGKTGGEHGFLPGGSVHPRVHGEDDSLTHARSWKFGSPPCARGRLGEGVADHAGKRFTPVCTGKTWHPFSFAFLAAGSPPCARGRRTACPRDRRRWRFTPVCTGKTVVGAAGAVTRLGSPPCARGRRRPCPSREAHGRFTPVCTGKT